MNKYIGVDISKKDFYACFEESGDPILFGNNKIGIKTFEKYLNTHDFKKDLRRASQGAAAGPALGWRRDGGFRH